MKVFVTGGSSFVGGHLIERLVRDGHEVVAMARSDRSAERVAGYGATPSRCDLDLVGARQARRLRRRDPLRRPRRRAR
ncbi:MAG: NAD-dependent epimerase/dehydratase family protein [Polyangiales bacterium]